MDYESSLIGDFPVAPFSFPILLRKLYLRRIKDDGKLINTSSHSLSKTFLNLNKIFFLETLLITREFEC